MLLNDNYRTNFVLSATVKPSENEVVEEEEKKLKPPPMYEVCLLNDDYTPMEFVILVLQKFFAMKKENATHVMLKVHREGRGVCGVYSKDVATSKVSAVLEFAQGYQHPLQCVMEQK
jgi:ATP-dependent Clp protease adaptor protein ClpS